MPVLTRLRPHSELAGAWFLNSGIQEETGGVARYYRSDTTSNARISTEITGYTISALVYLFRRTDDSSYLQSAVDACRFLIQTAWDPNLSTFPYELPGNGDAQKPLAYFFDSGIIIRSLSSLAAATRNPEYLEIAVRAGRSLASDFKASDGYHPVIELPEKIPTGYTAQWSRSPGCYQLKSALAWHDLANATGDPQFRSLYESAVLEALSCKESFLPAGTPEGTMDRLHAYCYMLEGMLPLAGRADCSEALAEGIERVAKYLRSIRPLFVRSDVYAQLLRARLFANQLAGIPLNREAAEEEAAHIPDFQVDSADRRVAGGFYFGRKGRDFLPYVNPVSTAFCMQALEMWADFEAGNQLDIDTLI